MTYRQGNHILTATGKMNIPGNMIFFDSEARVSLNDLQFLEEVKAGNMVEKIHDVFLICACFYSRDGIERWNDYYRGQFKRRFWRDVDKFTSPGTKTWVFAHNAKYDVMATGAVPYLVKRGYTVTSFSDDNPFILQLTKSIKSKKKTIIIVSSTNYYKTSLADLGEVFDLPKLESAFNSGIKEAIVYCRRDVEIVKAAMLGFIDFIKAENLGSFAMTIAGQAFNAFRHRFLGENEIYIHSDERALKVERAAYCGGRTEVWRMGYIDTEIFCLDVNSQYPFVMLNNPYPVRLKTIRNKLTPEQVMKFIDAGDLITAVCDVTCNIPLFPVKKGRLIFPVGKYEVALCTPEIIEGIKRGFITELKEVCIYDSGFIFASYVGYFYGKRLESKHKGDSVRTLLFKYFLNSLYGKFGQRAIEWEIVGKAPPDVIRTERIYDFKTGKERMIKIFGGAIFAHIEKEGKEAESSNSFPVIAAHVTSYARVLLWSFIEQAGLENVYYMDTDSLFVNKQGYTNLLSAGALDDDRLGALKLEKQGEMSIFGVKDYVFNGKEKLKGIPKSAIKISDTEYMVNTWIGMSKLIRVGNLEGYKNVLIKKKLSRKYTKGYIRPGGKVEPLKMRGDKIYKTGNSINFNDLKNAYKEDLKV